MGELRGVVPDKVKVMALTATASHPTQQCILRSLQPTFVYVSPQKKKMMNSVQKKQVIEKLVEEITPLKEYAQNNMMNVLLCIVCLSTFLGHTLQSLPLHHIYRVADMYTRCTEASVKEAILQSFSENCINLI